jgi:signal transduction histidine kinase/uncharacterized membrane protein YuzA (DUF378 family)
MLMKRFSRLERLNRQGWALWIFNFFVVMALTATVPLLYFPLIRTIADGLGMDAQFRQAYYEVIGLSGLVCIFCLYVAFKQRELNTMRDALEREESDKRDISSRLSELSELFKVSTSLNLQFKLESILEIIVRRVVAALRAQQASIMIYNPETGILETRASYGLESELALSARKKLGEGIAGWVAANQESVQLDGNRRHHLFGQAHYKPNRNITSALSLPLVVGGRCVGVLNVNRINNLEIFREYHSETLKFFAEHVAAVIDRAEIVQRLGSRTTELEEDNRKLHDMNRMKDVFLSTASHELKTPLTSVIGYAELLGDKSGRISDEQRSEFLKRLRGEAHRLLALIDEILDVSRIECGKLVLHRSPMVLNEVVRSAAETTRSLAESHGSTIVEDFDPSLPLLEIDEVKMRQVVINLLVNAAKYNPRGGRIVVRTGRHNDFATIEVCDEGPGIHPEDAAHMFELFRQGLHGADRQAGGLGIGLHLVKRLTELHGGHVSVKSSPGNGSVFIVRLPLALAGAGDVTGELAEPALEGAA